MSWIVMLLLIHAIVGKPTEEEEDYPDYEHSIGTVLCSEGFTMGTNGCEEIVEIEPFTENLLCIFDPTSCNWAIKKVCTPCKRGPWTSNFLFAFLGCFYLCMHFCPAVVSESLTRFQYSIQKKEKVLPFSEGYPLQINRFQRLGGVRKRVWKYFIFAISFLRCLTMFAPSDISHVCIVLRRL